MRVAVSRKSLCAPWFYIRLPSGGYTILAGFPRQMVLVKDVFIQEGRQRSYLLRGD
jgi:hypothetical protein